jgi:hypothetical protein
MLEANIRFELLGQIDQHLGGARVQTSPVLDDNLDLFHGRLCQFCMDG